MVKPFFYKKAVYPWTVEGTAHTSDHTLTDDDLAVGVDASSNDVTITVPAATTFARYPRSWFVKRMDAGNNAVVIKLAVPSDSMYGAQFSSMSVPRQGQGIELTLNANGTYTFSNWSGVESTAPPVVSTQTPTKFGGDLWMWGTLEDLGSNASVDVYFRHRDATTMGAWVETTPASQSSVGAFSDSWTMPGGDTAHIFEVQAMCDDELSATHYGAVMSTAGNYYSDTAEAAADGLERYWPMQESSDIPAVETMSGDDMAMTGGIPAVPENINGHTIYKRVFSASDWGQSGYAPNWTWTGSSKTILLQIDNNSASGDHTMLNFGRNRLSIASDGTGVQIEVNSLVQVWASATPMSGILNLFIVVDTASWQTICYTCTPAARTQRTQVWNVPNRQATYTRLARGTAGDANHQNNEYMDNGDVRSMAVWDRVLTEPEMKAICTTLDTEGELIVA